MAHHQQTPPLTPNDEAHETAGAKFTAMHFGGKARPIDEKAAHPFTRISKSLIHQSDNSNCSQAIRNMHLNIYQNRVNAAKRNCLCQCMHLILPKDNPMRGCVWQAMCQASSILFFHIDTVTDQKQGGQ
ncbi:hypothetical protein OAN83_02695 [Alphaproteobacteria bacterium]|nr:hypothetical protein [Alphaproteobacteria bacterium]